MSYAKWRNSYTRLVSTCHSHACIGGFVQVCLVELTQSNCAGTGYRKLNAQYLLPSTVALRTFAVSLRYVLMFSLNAVK
jgi:hypothetical protein